MIRSLFILIAIVACSLFLFTADSPAPDIHVLFPPSADSISYDQGKIILVSVSTQSVPQLLVSTQWEFEKMIPISDKPDQENFPKSFYQLFSNKGTMQSLTYTYKFYNGYSKPETLSFAYTDTMTIATFWKNPTFTQLVKTVLKGEAEQIILHIRGWQDTVYTPVYDDPTASGRTLYKVLVQLIPGMNSIYFSPSVSRSNAVLFTTTYINDSKPPSEREIRFHNSELEQNCTSCHDGLPSADSGKTMTADCATCHQEKAASTFKHPPVEAKECTTCHSWSPEKKAVVVELGVPQTCFTCHSDIETAVDSSAVQHPVASDCLTCHSPHSTVNQHILKLPVYTLCSGCHDKETINHPVGRHPVRFATIAQTNEELSCASCHQPHGSANEHLIKSSGGPMSLCVQCH